MSNPITRISVGLLLSACLFGPLAAEEPAGYSIDSIYDLDGVRDISFPDERGGMLITMSDRVIRYDTFPLEVTAEIGMKIDAITSVMTKDQTLVVLGDDRAGAYPRLGEKKGIERYATGVILVYPKVTNSSSVEADPFIIPLTTTPFSDSLLTDDGVLFATNPTWLSVVRTSVVDIVDFLSGSTETPFYLDDLFLQCGTASDFSVFENNGRPFYIASVTGSKQIEYGPIEFNTGNLPQSDCFDPGGISRTKSVSRKSLNENALQHALIANPDAEEDPLLVPWSLMTFDADSNLLTLFPVRDFRGKLTMSRSSRFSYDMQKNEPFLLSRAGQFGLMGSDVRGDTILVSFLGARQVFRFRHEAGEILFSGVLDFEKPVQRLVVSDDGNYAAIALGDARQDMSEELVLIRNPRAIQDSERLGPERFSVLSLQEILEKTGFTVTKDGILGPETEKAVRAFRAKLDGTEIGSNADLAGVLGAAAALLPTGSANETELESTPEFAVLKNSIRALFPLGLR